MLLLVGDVLVANDESPATAVAVDNELAVVNGVGNDGARVANGGGVDENNGAVLGTKRVNDGGVMLPVLPPLVLDDDDAAAGDVVSDDDVGTKAPNGCGTNAALLAGDEKPLPDGLLQHNIIILSSISGPTISKQR
jgi:hypothetical protein